MSQKSPVHAFRTTHVLERLPERLRTERYIVPMIVKDMGQLIGLEADARHIDWEADILEQETRDAYQQLASDTALLMDLYSIGVISDTAIASVSHPLASRVDPLVSLHARVDHLFRSYTQQEPDQVRADAEKLWAALEYRCQDITDAPFSQILKAG